MISLQAVACASLSYRFDLSDRQRAILYVRGVRTSSYKDLVDNKGLRLYLYSVECGGAHDGSRLQQPVLVALFSNPFGIVINAGGLMTT